MNSKCPAPTIANLVLSGLDIGSLGYVCVTDCRVAYGAIQVYFPGCWLCRVLREQRLAEPRGD